MSTTAPKATAQGTLEKTPFAHLVQFIFARELSGTLAVWPDDEGAEAGVGQDRILFHHGAPVAMRCRNPDVAMEDALETLFAFERAPYAFYEQQNLLGKSEGVQRRELDPYAVLSRGVRAHADPTQVEAVLGRVGPRQVRLRVGFPVERLQLSAPERELVERLRQEPLSLEQVALRAGGDRGVVRRLLYLLLLVKGLESLEASTRGASVRPASSSTPPPAVATGGVAVPKHPSLTTTAVGGPAFRALSTPAAHPRVRTPSRPTLPPVRSAAPGRPQPASIPPPDDAPIPAKPAGLSAATANFWDEVVGRLSELDHLNHFDLLGVSQRGSEAEATAAYFALVKRWHPDRIPAELSPLEPHIREIFERMTEAHDTLTSEEKRVAYIKTVSDGGGTRAADRMMAAVVESAMEMQKAEVLLRRRNYPEAFELVQRAIEHNPDEADNYAVRGWLLHLMEPGEGAPVEEILADIDRTLEGNAHNAKAHYYKGVVLKQLGRIPEAVRHFIRASQLDPRHIEAQREVRLAQIRKQSIKPGKKPSGGLWSKLFPRDD